MYFVSDRFFLWKSSIRPRAIFNFNSHAKSSSHFNNFFYPFYFSNFPPYGIVSNSATATHHNTSREGAKRDRLMFAFAHTTPLKFALLVQRKRANVAI
jgi:hypothetical protein